MITDRRIIERELSRRQECLPLTAVVLVLVLRLGLLTSHSIGGLTSTASQTYGYSFALRSSIRSAAGMGS